MRSIVAPMEVFAVTIFMSLAFAVLFAVLFLGERAQRKHRSIEQDALLPLDDGAPVRVRNAPPVS
jgi:predicted secreted protein